MGVVTEPGLSDGESLEEEIEDLVLGTGLNMIYRNREVNDRGFSHGGVGIVFLESSMSLQKVKIHNPKKFEVAVAEGKLKGCGRKVVIIGCYIPLNYNVPRGREAMEFIASNISNAKRRLEDPLMVVAGDFNQWRVEETLVDFPDLREHAYGNTRGDRCIDRSFSNLPDVSVSGT